MRLIKVISLILLSILLLQMVTAGTVTRSFNSAAAIPGQPLVVTLTVDVQSGDLFYIIEENIPAGWTVTAATPTGDQNVDYRTDPRRFLVTVLNNPADTVYTYMLTVPSTAASSTAFTGQVGFSGTPIPIVGATSISVGTSGNQLRACTEVDWNCSPWSVCTNGAETRLCNSPSPTLCRAGVIPLQSRSCGGTTTCPNGATPPACLECPAGQEFVELSDGRRVCSSILQDVREAIRGTDNQLSLISRIASSLRSFLTSIFG